jgi:predicted N-acetyltransferase YhbS
LISNNYIIWVKTLNLAAIMNNLLIRPPQTDSEVHARDQLLMKSLRKPHEKLPISLEYPLVLHKSYLNRSLGVYHQSGQLMAHLNYLPRNIINAQGETKGTLVLMGNVATEPRYQSQGIMGQTIRHMQTRVVVEGHQGILLWSELDSFYQKLGFRGVGYEYRMGFEVRQLEQALLNSQHQEFIKIYHKIEITTTPASALDDGQIKHLLTQRYPVALSLSRSCEEYRKLLSIPQMTFGRYQSPEGTAYAFINRGSDMFQTVHEWGTRRPEILLLIALKLAIFCQFSEFMILLPGSIDQGFFQSLNSRAATATKHPLGFLWENPVTTNDQKSEGNFEQLFIWGLDSI